MGTKTGYVRIIARDKDNTGFTVEFESSSVAYDISGWSDWTLRLYKFEGSTEVLTETSAITAASSSAITIEFDTASGTYYDLEPREYVFELDATLPGNTLPTTIFAGPWIKQAKGAAPINFSDSTTIEI